MNATERSIAKAQCDKAISVLWPIPAAKCDFPRFMRYARRVKGITLSAREMRELLAKTEA